MAPPLRYDGMNEDMVFVPDFRWAGNMSLSLQRAGELEVLMLAE